MNRRDFIQALGVGGLALASGAAPASGTINPSIASTKWGKVRGREIDGVHVFKGIRYAATSGGKNRFLPPRNPDPWSGTVDAVEESPQCYQVNHDKPATPGRIELPESEDCLKLNVWTPGMRDGKKRPVMVWLHTGGLWHGANAGNWEDWPAPARQAIPPGGTSGICGPKQEGRNLSKNGNVVVVSPNHRLAVMGFTYLDDLDPYFQGSGNAGILDLVAALQWVRDNIAEFGGDPDNVCIFGLSGGGQKVSLLLAMPAAQKLFHRAVIMSGPCPVTLTPDYATEMTLRLLANLGFNKKSARKIQDVPPEAIMHAYHEILRTLGENVVWGLVESGFAPVVDGRTLPKQPFWNGAPEFSKNVPLMLGYTPTEMTAFTLARDPSAYPMDWVAAEHRVAALLYEDGLQIMAQFRTNHPKASPWEIYSMICALWPTGAFAHKIAEERSKVHGAPVYMYRTEWRTPVRGGILMTPHAMDLSFVMDTTESDRAVNGGGEEPRAMAKLMSNAWVAFARSGSPQTKDLPDWPPFDEEKRPTMVFNLPPRMALDPDAADRKVIQDYMRRYRPIQGGPSAHATVGW